MGILEKIDSMQLSDEEKAELRREYAEEVDPLKAGAQRDRATAKLAKVEGKVAELKSLFGDQELPATLKFARRVWLSDDEQPATVLLSDADLGLSGDDAIGATGKQEISCSDVLDMFIATFPKTEEGKLKIALSDQALANEGDDPPDDGNEPDAEKKSEQARKNLTKATGREVKVRTRGRYRGGAVSTGGGS